MKKIISLLCLILSVATCAEQQEMLIKKQVQEVNVQCEAASESEVSVEKKPVLKKSEFTSVNNQRPDIVDMFVDSSNYASAHINIIDLWFTTAFVAGKILYSEPSWSTSHKKYLVFFSMVVLGATGILKLGAYCRYHLYRFVRSGVETIAPEKMLTAFNKKMALLEPYSFLASLAGVGCAFAYYCAFGPLQKKAAGDITVYLLKSLFNLS